MTTYFFSSDHKNVQEDPDPFGAIINWPPRSGSVLQDYGSTDPNPIEKVRDPQNWSNVNILGVTGEYFCGGERSLSSKTKVFLRLSTRSNTRHQ